MSRFSSQSIATKVGLGLAGTGLIISGAGCSNSESSPPAQPESTISTPIPQEAARELGGKACRAMYSLLYELTWRGPTPIHIMGEIGTLVDSSLERQDLRKAIKDENGTIASTQANFGVLAAISTAAALDKSIAEIMNDPRAKGIDPASIKFMNESGNDLTPMVIQAVDVATEAYTEYCSYLPDRNPDFATPTF